MSAHRYWRLYVTSVQGPTINNIAVAELELRETPGGPDVTGSGTASAWSVYPGSSASSAVANDGTTTIWAANNNAPPGWWAYDFGPGVTKDIVEVWMQARNDSYYYQSPKDVTLQFSDDGIAWTDYKLLYAATPWTAGSSQVLAAVPPKVSVAQVEAYALIESDAAQLISQATAYALLDLDPAFAVSQIVAYALLEDQDPFAVSAVFPPSGSVGTALTLQGTGFVAGAAVSFNGLAGTNVVVVDEQHITCVVPAIDGYIGLVDIVVTQGQATSTGGAGIFTYLDPWRVQTATPNNGYLGGGEQIAVGGAGFDDPDLIVTFGGIQAAIVSIEATQIVCTAPPRDSPSAVAITVRWPDGKTRTLDNGYTYLAPGVSGIVPNRLPRTGGTATVHGGGFVPGATVQLDSTPVPTVYVSSTELTITMQSMPRGIYDVGIYVPGKDYTPLVDGLQVTEPAATRKTTMFTVV